MASEGVRYGCPVDLGAWLLVAMCFESFPGDFDLDVTGDDCLELDALLAAPVLSSADRPEVKMADSRLAMAGGGP